MSNGLVDDIEALAIASRDLVIRLVSIRKMLLWDGMVPTKTSWKFFFTKMFPCTAFYFETDDNLPLF